MTRPATNRYKLRNAPPVAENPINLYWALALALIPFLAYLPAMQSGFIWDDDRFLTENPLIKYRDGLYRFWFTTQAPDYFPLTSSMLWIEWRLWHLNATGYHVVNVLLHSGTAVMLWRVLERLKAPAPWIAALLFALHPVCVESVAWITERKNTLSMFFMAASFLLYLKYESDATRRWYAAALLCFLLALLAKTSVVMLPVILLLSAWWQRGKITTQDLLRALPFFILSAALGLLTVWFQYERNIGEDVVRSEGWLYRVAGAGWALWFYIYKAVLPIRLCFVYPTPAWLHHAVIGLVPLVAFAVLLAVLWTARKRAKPLLFALSGFAVSLLPVLGFIDIYFMKYALVADHWQYLALPWAVALLVGVASRLFSSVNLATRQATAAVVAVIVFGLTWHEQAQYKNEHTLWNTTTHRNPAAWMAWNNLGVLLEKRGSYQQALEYYQKALAVKPDQIDALSGIGNVLAAQGKHQDAINQYQQVLKVDPRRAKSHNNIGNAYSALGARKDAIRHFETALEIKPGFPFAHNNLALVLAAEGRSEEALKHYQLALDVDPDYLEARMNLANQLAQMSRFDEALVHYDEAIRMQPKNATIYYNRANALELHGKPEDAKKDYLEALKLRPGFAEAMRNLQELEAKAKI